MTNGWIDIKNTDMMLIMGGNPAENHPCGFKWAMEAKRNRNAKLISVDPRFTRTSATADLFVQIRAGSDIAFLGGLIRYASRTTGSPRNISSTTQTPHSSLRKVSSFLKTVCTPDLTRRRALTTRPLGIIRRGETSAVKRTLMRRVVTQPTLVDLLGLPAKRLRM